MTFRGHIQNGRLVLDDGRSLPEGTEVRVDVVSQSSKPKRKAGRRGAKRRSTAEVLAPFIGKAEGLPPDFSAQLDHYVYGVSKRRR